MNAPRFASLPWVRGLRAVWWAGALLGGAWLVVDLWLAHGVLGDPERGFRATWFYRYADFGFWWLLLPVLVWWRRRLDALPRWWLLPLAHVAAAALAGGLALSARVLILLVANRLPAEFFLEVLRDATTWRSFLWCAAIYVALIVPIYAAGFYLSWRAEQREAAELKVANAQVETRLVRANLDALKMQLHPHFLFNALNSITALIRRDRGEEAEEAVAKLGNLLRRALDHKQDQFVTLEAELEFLEHYFAIERIRFQDRLLVDLAAGPECLGARVPSLLLQPLVENAMKHGFSRATDARHLRLHAWRDPDHLYLELYNDGPPLPDGFTGVGSGIGLRNTRARLEMLYGGAADLTLLNSPGGVTARVTLPLQFASPP
jgi:two-component system LytT family sensor kinase